MKCSIKRCSEEAPIDYFPLCEMHEAILRKRFTPDTPQASVGDILGAVINGETPAPEVVAGVWNGFVARVETFRQQRANAVAAPSQPQRRTPRQAALIVLGFDMHATPTQAEIKRQFRTLAAKHHPDKGGDPKAMARLNKAMEILVG